MTCTEGWYRLDAAEREFVKEHRLFDEEIAMMRAFRMHLLPRPLDRIMSEKPAAYIEHRKRCGNCQGCDFTNEPYARCAEGSQLLEQVRRPRVPELRTAIARLPVLNAEPSPTLEVKPISTKLSIDIHKEPVVDPERELRFAGSISSAFEMEMRAELYRRQYRDERKNHEWVDMGGES